MPIDRAPIHEDAPAEPRLDLAGGDSSLRAATTASRATIRDVARRAGVSPATVSRVLTGSAVVKAEIRSRVILAISELGYRPNQVARNLRRQKAEMIGVIIADIENPFFSEMVRAVEDAAYTLGYRVVLCNTDENVEKQRSYLEVMAAERVLGVILAPSDPGAREIGELLDLGIPVVAFDRAATDVRADSVTTNNVRAGRIAATHLIQAGHQHIAFISSSGVVTVRDRVAGYEEIMRAADLEPRSVSGFSRLEGGIAATKELLRDKNRPTALIAGNGLMALGVLKTLRSHRISIPDEMALVIFDDPFWAEITHPALTALAQPVRQMAQTVVALLVDRLHGEVGEPRHLVFDFELRVRGSSRNV